MHRRPVTAALAAGLATVALGLGLAACGGGSSDSGGSTASGAEIYAQQCARCHGANGQGGIGPSLLNLTPTFPNADDQKAFVANGGGSMPQFSQILSDAQLDAVVAYTRETFK